MAKGVRKQSVAQKSLAQRGAELKIAGATWPQIAKELGYESEAGARHLVTRYLDAAQRDMAEQMYPVLAERGELMWRKAWAKVNQADAEGSFEKWERAMRQGNMALTFLARINGLSDGPQVQVNVHPNLSIRQLRQEFTELRANAAENAPTSGDNVIESELTPINNPEDNEE